MFGRDVGIGKVKLPNILKILTCHFNFNSLTQFAAAGKNREKTRDRKLGRGNKGNSEKDHHGEDEKQRNAGVRTGGTIPYGCGLSGVAAGGDTRAPLVCKLWQV